MLQLPSTEIPAIKHTYLICKQEEQCSYKGRSACRQVQGRYSCTEGVSRIRYCQLQQDMVTALKAEAQRLELDSILIKLCSECALFSSTVSVVWLFKAGCMHKP